MIWTQRIWTICKPSNNSQRTGILCFTISVRQTVPRTLRITSSGKTSILMYSNSSRRVRISFMGFDWDFLAMAHTPTTTFLPPPSHCGSGDSHRSNSPWSYHKQYYHTYLISSLCKSHCLVKFTWEPPLAKTSESLFTKVCHIVRCS